MTGPSACRPRMRQFATPSPWPRRLRATSLPARTENLTGGQSASPAPVREDSVPRPEWSQRSWRFRLGSVFGHQYGDHLVSMAAVDAEVFIQGERKLTTGPLSSSTAPPLAGRTLSGTPGLWLGPWVALSPCRPGRAPNCSTIPERLLYSPPALSTWSS